MAYKNKVRVSVPLSHEIDERLIKLSNTMCMSKSQLCSLLITQQLDTYETSFAIMNDPVKMRQFQKLLSAGADEHIKNMLDSTVDEKKE
ncbi:MAG: hypothetical protein EOM11_07455 [Erysipelotrichia bacterium]|nr:hypothetical protein [Erysipelotrichia bacterium]